MILPLEPWQILVGKLAPAFLVGIVSATFTIGLITLVYGVPLTGSLVLLYFALMFYMLTLAAIGVTISLLKDRFCKAYSGGSDR